MNGIDDLMSDGFAAPLGHVIAAIGRGVAEAQAALDAAALAQTRALYFEEGEAAWQALRDIGYRPTFYVLPETVCEVQVSMRIGGAGAADGSAGATAGLPGEAVPLRPALAPVADFKARTYVTPVDAGFASRFGFQSQATAKLTFKIIPVPPPSALDERLVPDLAGLVVGDAITVLSRGGLRAEVVGASGTTVPASDRAGAAIHSQDPAPGTVVPFGTIVLVKSAGPEA